MRRIVLACLLVSCAGSSRAPLCAVATAGAPASTDAPAVHEGPAAEPPPPAPPELQGERLLYATGGPIRDRAITEHIEPRQAKQVNAALFRHHLSDLAECPKSPFFEPTTWVEVDELQSRNLEAGRFVPVVEQRIEGTFTRPDETELLFVVRVDNCQTNTFTHRELAIFPATLGKPRLRWSESELNARSPRFVAVARAEHGSPRLLEALGQAYRLVELNRPFVPGAPLRHSATVVTTDGRSVVEPWAVLAEWSLPPPLECRGFFEPLEASGTVRLETKPGACPSP